MKLFLRALVIGVIFSNAVYAAPSREAGTSEATPYVLYGKDSSGNLRALLTDTDGTLNTSGAAGGSTFDTIGDSTADGSIAQAGFEMDWTSTLDSANKSIWTITNTDADTGADTAFLTFAHNDSNDANIFYLLATSDLDASVGGPYTEYSLSQTRATINPPATVQALTINGQATPSAPSAVDASVAGNPNGVYLYKVGYCTNTSCSDGTESASSSASGSVSVTNSQITVTIPVSTDPQTAARRLYRTQAGGSTYTALDIVTNNTATTYTDNIADATIASNARDREADESANILNKSGNILFTESDENLFLGRNAGQDSTFGNKNTGIGAAALTDITTGTQNTGVGFRSLFVATSATHNTAIGTESLDANTTGTRNVAIGFGAGGGNVDQSDNVYIGTDSAASLNGQLNVMMGYHAGFAMTTGDQNVFIGTNAGDAPTSATNVILIGYASDTAAGRSNAGCIGSGCNPTADNAFVIGGSTAFNVGINSPSPRSILDIDKGTGVGQLTLDGSAGGCIMLQDTDDAGWTECDALNGTLSCSTDADGVCD